MMKWVTNRTLAASRKSRKKGKQQKMFYPVLLAHGGNRSDFPMLVDNISRHKASSGYLYPRLRVGDTYQLCVKLQENGLPIFDKQTKLGMEGLHKLFFPGEDFKDRHSALGDARLMRQIFGGPLRNHLEEIETKTLSSFVGLQKKKKKKKETKPLAKCNLT
ncbi:uncharacterized protein LOC114531168 [Dendronephthya gigantea]|uniref:uncharacterized protein LOC114531168 n=1 Tax=Dendronephthya gigantea TaxID=151771 RepID=UPI00106C5F96|nr:uncharacterized protein LOC114531168 [Dendronephthya gigantea]